MGENRTTSPWFLIPISFIEFPIRPSRRVRSVSEVVESPVRGTRKSWEERQVISPNWPPKHGRIYDIIVSPRSKVSKRPRKYRQPAKKCPKRQKTPELNCFVIAPFGDNNCGFVENSGHYNDYYNSPEPDNGVNDGIDWSATGEENDRLKGMVVPVYWEALLQTPNSVVRVTQRLYILWDWNT